MKWYYIDLIKWIVEGCNPEIGNQVIVLNISNSRLEKIPIEMFQLVNLREFSCYYNKLSTLPKEIGRLVKLEKICCNDNPLKELPKEIGNLVNLQYFYCSYTKLLTLPKEIGNLENLRRFYCNHNKIIELPREICNLINLQEFQCFVNNISKLPVEIGSLVNLREFACSINKIKILPKEIGKLVNLKKLHCSNNQISELPGEIGNLINLQEISCNHNKISKLSIELLNCRNLIEFNYSNNEIEYIPPQIIRWLNPIKSIQHIYNDNQSVHNHNIQEGIRNSINYLMRSKPTLTLETLKDHIINNDLLEAEVKDILFEYCSDKTIHSVLNITFEELLLSIYDFILKHTCANDIFNILNADMKDSLCKCFTGRISRLVNVLNGIDENIKINISQAEQIGNIFILVRDKLEREGRYTHDLFKEIVMKELVVERGYDETVINDWISFSG